MLQARAVPGTPISSARHTKLLPPAQRSRAVTRPLAGRSGGLCPWGPPPDSSLPAPSALATPHPRTKSRVSPGQDRASAWRLLFLRPSLVGGPHKSTSALVAPEPGLLPPRFASRTFLTKQSWHVRAAHLVLVAQSIFSTKAPGRAEDHSPGCS